MHKRCDAGRFASSFWFLAFSPKLADTAQNRSCGNPWRQQCSTSQPKSGFKISWTSKHQIKVSNFNTRATELVRPSIPNHHLHLHPRHRPQPRWPAARPLHQVPHPPPHLCELAGKTCLEYKILHRETIEGNAPYHP